MSQRRQWKAKEKAAIVIAGLQGSSTIAELCNKHGISQGQYYQWRDRFLEESHTVFARGGASKERERLLDENRTLKTVIGDHVKEEDTQTEERSDQEE